MSEQSDELLFKIARSRVMVSRIFAVLILLLAIFTMPPFKQGDLADILSDTSGLFLLTICSMGRLWALLYISGKKTHEVITDGPYSIVRHPLYLFSFIGAIGIGLASDNILVLAALVIFYLSYYPLTILSEEKILTKKFGQTYIDYAKCTPRFLPKLSLYKSPDHFAVNANILLKNLALGMWFIWIFILFNVIQMLQTIGIIHVLLKVP
ncbi:MAG: isoprenylcysteine carboxylmethyltransferase family protein [Sedimentisphaerales bacterium]|jgi:protein-S-isoprenylcysteine O-methyltransferase Ste14